MDRALAWCAACIAAAAAALLVLFGTVLGVGEVRGSSEAAGLREGDAVLYLRIPSSYEEGDVALVNVRRATRAPSGEGSGRLGSDGGDVVGRVTAAPPGESAPDGWYWIEGVDEAVPREALDGKVLLMARVLKGTGDA